MAQAGVLVDSVGQHPGLKAEAAQGVSNCRRVICQKALEGLEGRAKG